jgi:isocitrate dehydrogenase
VQQFQAENHLRWDSLGEFLAIGVSLEELAEKTDNKKLTLVAAALNQASSQYLTENRSPSRKVNELDNRGSHFYLALYWAQALATQTNCPELQAEFSQLAATLAENEQAIVDQLIAVQGAAVDLGGYYHPCEQSVVTAMRPSTIFNDAIDGFSDADNEH